MDLISELTELNNQDTEWRKTTAQNLNLDYGIIIPISISKSLFTTLEDSIIYDSAEKSQIKIFGKWQKIPRQQVAFGDEGISYRFSGKTFPAQPWTTLLHTLKDLISNLTETNFNFVLINRYANGSDYIGEHRDNEPDLDPNAPIASLSLGQSRDFILKHRDCRQKSATGKNIPIVKILLENGSLLLMKCPTNKYWYHSLPPRKKATGVRINLTFRVIKNKNIL